eukprot:TRINITY_DN18801_c0_g1_i1.p1 TRINITY_DN18801_c0_g1~~TRINITY_DN18801_c0_g1_i1.p1  ORF type:complete len:427 (-),score=78.72 TRINITY_DN18801_c0_g1_i1:525-1805(-)
MADRQLRLVGARRSSWDPKAILIMTLSLVLFILYFSSSPSVDSAPVDEQTDPRPVRPAILFDRAPMRSARKQAFSRTRGGGFEDLSEWEWEQLRAEVVTEFQHAFQGYRKFAWGHDEVRPVSNITNDSWGGFAVTLIDALDTMLLMELREEFELSKEFVINHVDFDKDWDASFFEYTIRYVGGLVSAYELSGDRAVLDQAQRVGDRLLKAFEGAPTGLPHPIVNLRTGVGKTPGWNRGKVSLSEIGSCQLEFASLSRHTGDPKYTEAAQSVYGVLDKIPRANYVRGGIDMWPLLPLELDIKTGTQFSGDITLCGRSDSYYEYLLKYWLLTGKRDEQMRGRYDGARKAIEKHLIRRSASANLAVLATFSLGGGGGTQAVMEHLACFTPGMMALGGCCWLLPPILDGRCQRRLELEFAREGDHSAPGC